MKAEGCRRRQKAERGRQESENRFPLSVCIRAAAPSAFCLLPVLAFTLVELILVMALLVTLLALAVPSLSRSLRQRNLEQEAARLLALTEYGRDEAASQGVPVVVWIDPDNGPLRRGSQEGFRRRRRAREGIHAQRRRICASTHPRAGWHSPVQGHGFNVAEFAPDGTLDPASVAALRITDSGHHAAISLTQTTDGYGYQIIKEVTPMNRRRPPRRAMRRLHLCGGAGGVVVPGGRRAGGGHGADHLQPRLGNRRPRHARGRTRREQAQRTARRQRLADRLRTPAAPSATTCPAIAGR